MCVFVFASALVLLLFLFVLVRTFAYKRTISGSSPILPLSIPLSFSLDFCWAPTSTICYRTCGVVNENEITTTTAARGVERARESRANSQNYNNNRQTYKNMACCQSQRLCACVSVTAATHTHRHVKESKRTYSRALAPTHTQLVIYLYILTCATLSPSSPPFSSSSLASRKKMLNAYTQCDFD